MGGTPRSAVDGVATHAREIDRAGRAYDWAMLARLIAWMFPIAMVALPLIADVQTLLSTPVFGIVFGVITVLALPLVPAVCWPEPIWARFVLMATAIALAGIFTVNVTLVLPLATMTLSGDAQHIILSLLAAAGVWLGLLLWVLMGLELSGGFARLGAMTNEAAALVREPRQFLSLFGVPPGLRFMGHSKVVTFGQFVGASLLMIFPLLVIASSIPLALIMGGKWLRGIVDPDADFGSEVVGDPFLIYEAIAAGVCLLLAYLLRRSAERKCIASASEAMKADTRRPILFLRAFKDDRVEFARPRLTPLCYLVSALTSQPTTLDALLVREFASYGPVVAIGNPQERVRLFGVFRDFHDEDTWRTAVSRLAHEAAAIVVAVDETEGLGWELELLADGLFRDKTLLVAPSRFKGLEDNARLWGTVSAKLNTRILENGEPFAEPILAAFANENGQLCVATSGRFSSSDYHMALRWYFRQREESQ